MIEVENNLFHKGLTFSKDGSYQTILIELMNVRKEDDFMLKIMIMTSINIKNQ